jgi:cytochrome b pre-mRNA-processing protein 3
MDLAGIWNPLRGARAQKDRADALYRGLMAAALAPEAYAAGVVPDDMEHRVQMVSLHAGLLVWQLTRRPEQPLRRLPQLIHARVFDGFDASLRETGVGDASIARKVRKLGEHYYGLGNATADCLAGPQDERGHALAALLNRNGVAVAEQEGVLADYLVAQAEAFEAAPSEVFLDGSLSWLAFPATSRPGVAKV